MAHAGHWQTDSNQTAFKNQQANADSADVDMSPAALQNQLTIGNAEYSLCMVSTAAFQDQQTYPKTIPSSDKEAELTSLPSDNGNNGPRVDADNVDADDEGLADNNNGPRVGANKKGDKQQGDKQQEDEQQLVNNMAFQSC
ncbi:hypothetical protein H2248_008022 [Termitomyces sp. 'cryptogamus']|nr:hypothetical protein H2248_008022 [Termitomyces sp. 'cryptogamus']